MTIAVVCPVHCPSSKEAVEFSIARQCNDCHDDPEIDAETSMSVLAMDTTTLYYNY